MKNWDKYLQKNREGYCDCQVVSAVNAYYHLTGKIIGQDTKRYLSFVTRSHAEYGAAICIDKVWKSLGLKQLRLFRSMYELFGEQLERVKSIRLPVDATVWHPKYGYHSVLIVEHCTRARAFRVCNFMHATTNYGWIFEEDFRMYQMHAQANCDRPLTLLGLEKKC